MDIVHQIFPQHKLVYIVLRGRNTIAELMQYVLDLPASDPDHSEDLDYLIDTRRAEASGESAASERTSLQNFIGAIPSTPQSVIKTATVLPSGTLEYGLSRMYGAELEESNIEYQLFDDLEAAINWLERPMELIEQLKL